jgi:5-formyltetrahydrofolate cyclo-ligase
MAPTYFVGFPGSCPTAFAARTLLRMNFIQEKTQLRERLRAARAAVSPAQAEAAARAVADRALALTLEKLENPAPVALYAPLPGELDSFPLLAELARIGFPTLLPVAGEKATPLTFRLWRPGAPLVIGRYGLSEPSASAPEMRPEILFLPLLGFDSEGTRLGFGGGYYDATLDHLRAKGLTAAVGLAFSCQQAKKIPRQSHDEKLDFVVTETGVFSF